MAFLHLLAHAFFKALLFISTGNIIHCSNDYQAIKISGRLRKALPLSYASNAICSTRLCGLPFMSAFFSKEPIIEVSNERGLRRVVYFLLFVGIIITVAYRVRLRFSTGVNRFQGSRLLRVEENLKFTRGGILLLFPGAVLGGSILRKYLIISPLTFHASMRLKLLALTMLLVGRGVGLVLIKLKFSAPSLVFI